MIENRIEELTGRRQFRQQGRLLRRPQVVLQVEVRVQGNRSYDCGRAGVEIERIDYCFWRDARPNDLLASAPTTLAA